MSIQHGNLNMQNQFCKPKNHIPQACGDGERGGERGVEMEIRIDGEVGC
jgi:hypothetical protein